MSTQRRRYRPILLRRGHPTDPRGVLRCWAFPIGPLATTHGAKPGGSSLRPDPWPIFAPGWLRPSILERAHTAECQWRPRRLRNQGLSSMASSPIMLVRIWLAWGAESSPYEPSRKGAQTHSTVPVELKTAWSRMGPTELKRGLPRRQMVSELPRWTK